MPVQSSHAQIAKVPTLYELQNHEIKVTYSTTSFVGKPLLNYQDQQQKLQFSGDEIRTTDTEIGQLVTVTIYKTVDTGSVTFSLLIPDVNLGNTNEAKIVTNGITTVNRFSTIPVLNQGQRQTYKVTPLFGTAKAVVF
ncbi:hypothetical protein H6G69_12310 [Nostoc sp. FACHB-110]|nr:hypothetical protein [Nostoc sp. FACHB-110]